MNFQKFFKAVAEFIGLEANVTNHAEKWISGAGGLCGILGVAYVTQQFVPVGDAGWIVASMGASAVLLYAVPHGPLSQPWSLVGGHLVSAIVGVTSAKLIPDVSLAAGVGVGLAITAMYYLRCIHPPGGATALYAVAGSESLHELGYMYVLTPVMLNTMVILAVAIGFNYLFAWRRYPASLARPAEALLKPESNVDEEIQTQLTRSDLEYALQSLNRTIDISSKDLQAIFHLAERHLYETHLYIEDIKPGHYYSNGHYGEKWQVRQIIDAPQPIGSANDVIIYKVVAGDGRRMTDKATIGAFARWARYEVFRNENSWQRQPLAEEA
ncbi:MAG: HPP family protein [Chromatiales bacterium]|jgi:CBS-domain-containing membrane protein